MTRRTPNGIPKICPVLVLGCYRSTVIANVPMPTLKQYFEQIPLETAKKNVERYNEEKGSTQYAKDGQRGLKKLLERISKNAVDAERKWDR